MAPISIRATEKLTALEFFTLLRKAEKVRELVRAHIETIFRLHQNVVKVLDLHSLEHPVLAHHRQKDGKAPQHREHRQAVK